MAALRCNRAVVLSTSEGKFNVYIKNIKFTTYYAIFAFNFYSHTLLFCLPKQAACFIPWLFLPLLPSCLLFTEQWYFAPAERQIKSFGGKENEETKESRTTEDARHEDPAQKLLPCCFLSLSNLLLISSIGGIQQGEFQIDFFNEKF